MSLDIKNIRPIISRAMSHIPYVTLLLTLAAGLIHLSYNLRIQLLYDRSALGNQDIWRLLTCHWVHLSWDHLFWSSTTFLGLGSLCELINKKKYYATVGISAVMIPAAIWWGMPGLILYGGLSGLDCALYALLMVLLIKREIRCRSWTWVTFFSLLLTGLMAKISYETVTGMTIFVSNNHSGMVPVPLAHLIGGIAGTGIGLIKDTAAAKRTYQQCPGRHSFITG